MCMGVSIYVLHLSCRRLRGVACIYLGRGGMGE